MGILPSDLAKCVLFRGRKEEKTLTWQDLRRISAIVFLGFHRSAARRIDDTLYKTETIPRSARPALPPRSTTSLSALLRTHSPAVVLPPKTFTAGSSIVCVLSLLWFKLLLCFEPLFVVRRADKTQAAVMV